jgi:integrase/recombinase XerD
MNQSLSPIPSRQLGRAGLDSLPAAIRHAGERAAWRFIEFFTASIRNKNTRAAYAQAVMQFFEWCEGRGLFQLEQITPVVIGIYIEGHGGAAPTVKQHLAAIRMLFDFLVLGQIVPANPCASVRGPKHVVKVGKTPVLKADQARALLDSIETDTIVGLRDLAIQSVMAYSFARVSAAVRMRVEDYYQNGKRWWFRFHEKGGKIHQVPAHHNAEAALDAYIEAAGIREEKKGPLFRTVDKHGALTLNPMSRIDVYRMIRRRARHAGIEEQVSCHTWRATGITAYLGNGGTIENAAAIANHESPRTTKLYDRTGDEITLDEVERIAI